MTPEERARREATDQAAERYQRNMQVRAERLARWLERQATKEGRR